MGPKSQKYCQNETGSAFPSRGQLNLKPSMLKRLKRLVAKSYPAASLEQSHAPSSTSTEAHRRRAEALKACGLLDQSVKYGGPYRDEPYYDEEDETKTIVSSKLSLRSDTEKEKDLLIFSEVEEKVEESTINKQSDGEVYTPMPPFTTASMYPVPDSDTTSITESDSSTIVSRQAPIRMRRIGSLTEEIDQIEDKESRRLAEIAFLS